MTEKVRLFSDGLDQIVRLPGSCRFDGEVVYIRRDPETGDVILSSKPTSSWGAFFAEDTSNIVPDDFMTAEDRRQGQHDRDPLADVGL
ncbi:antitoxin [Duganella sp. Dugasp56]|jgi:antitoxin VapB|uniref:antitoxin n=1 Tax=Duganella sp. Dugasp56 TaxID=3243046 RepID=UPI0039B111BE